MVSDVLFRTVQEEYKCTVRKKRSVTEKAGTNMTLDCHLLSFKMFFIEKKKSDTLIPVLNPLRNFF